MHRTVTKKEILKCSPEAKKVLEIVDVLKANNIFVSELDASFEDDDTKNHYLSLSSSGCYHIYKNEKFAKNNCASMAMLTLDGQFYIKPEFEKAADKLNLPIEFYIEYKFSKYKDSYIKFVNIINDLWNEMCGNNDKIIDFFLELYKKEELIIDSYYNKIQTIEKILND